MDTKSKSDWSLLFSIVAIVIGLLSILYCSTHIVEPLSQVESSKFFAQLSRYIRGGV
ncbi:hypothetical protein ACFOZY_10375 [Chungangia koreensis]|uniref:ATP synthase F0 subunit 8 n=1 Tax=Chungangia koreensis TaxID=752657 RepID=A0ABV8X5Y4_9LACT